MADIQLAEQSAPGTPAAGNGIIFIDSSAPLLCFKDETGRVQARSHNAAITSQGAGFATDTWVTNTDLQIPSFSMQAKSTFKWQLSCSKTAASTATPAYNIRIGPNRSTGDTARLTLTGPAQTAVIDIGTLNIIVVCESVGVAGIIQGTAWWDHRGTAANTTTSGTGFANDSTGHVEGQSAAFDNTALGGQYISLSINGGTASSWTFTLVTADADW